ncbi:MAG: MAPEG family protein [Hyphomonadaceae bacterium]
MSAAAVLAPLFAQVLLVFILLGWMAVTRGQALMRGAVAEQDVALREPVWPKRALQAANAFSNQFELPVLFYTATLLALAMAAADAAFVALAWVFVASRYAHAWEHVTTNVVRRRGLIYGAGMLVLLAMWVTLAVRVLMARG